MRYCMKPNCRATVESGFYCPEHRPAREPRVDTRKSANARGYDSRWRAWARRYLVENPLCAVCSEPAQVVGHHTLSADQMLDRWGAFSLEPKYYRPLCRRCNAKDKAHNGR